VRFFLAMMSHETNTFSNVPTDRAQFENRDLRYGGEILETFQDTGTCLGGMIEVARRSGVTLVPSVAASASPAGRVTADVYGAVKTRILADLASAGRRRRRRKRAVSIMSRSFYRARLRVSCEARLDSSAHGRYCDRT